MSCKHENADHHQHLCNGSIVAEWLQCLDCEALIKPPVIRGGFIGRRNNCAMPAMRKRRGK